ncbi:MAG: helix-turn-helix transcriptional regulator [Eubacteriales bacterium]
MSNTYDNYYKTCRTMAKITQEQAAELLHVSPRTMSDYENGHTRVPDDIVDTMATIYNSPLLAWWHLKKTSVLGKYIPDMISPKSNVDVAFQLILAQDDLSPTVDLVKKIMRDGIVSGDEEFDYEKAMETLKAIIGKLLSVVVFEPEKQ